MRRESVGVLLHESLEFDLLGLLAFLDLLFLLLPVELLLLALVLSGHRLHKLAFVNDFIAGNFYRVAIFVDLHADNFAVGVARIAGIVGGRILGSFVGKGIDLSLFQFTLDTFFDFFTLADTTTLQVLVLTLETFFVFGKGAVHNTEEIILYFLNIFLESIFLCNFGEYFISHGFKISLQ